MDVLEISGIIRKIRRERGYQSGLAFYRYLATQAELNFNYQYYVKMETGKTLPSAQVIRTLAGCLGNPDGDRLLVAYCRSLFPNRPQLFKDPEITPKKRVPPLKPSSAPTLGRARILTEKQVGVICRSKSHYYLFLVLTLSRKPVDTTTLEEALGRESLKRALIDLRRAKLAQEKEGQWVSTATEHKFPQASTRSLQLLYEKMDPWDLDFGSTFRFQAEYKKLLIRRVSKRHAGIVLGHCKLLVDLLLSAEEVDPDLNDEVVFFQLLYSKGMLPG